MPQLVSQRALRLFGCALLATWGGCAKLETVGKSTLPRAQMSADSVVLDLFFVRVPLGDPLANDELWAEADEQQLSAELRLKLANAGFRVGVLGNQIPPALERLVAEQQKRPVQETPAPQPTGEAAAGLTDQKSIAKFEAEPRVMQRHLQLRSGMPSEIIASKERESLVLLESEGDMVGGRSYRKGIGVLQLKSYPQADGRVRIELSPELQHGEPKMEFVDNSGAWMHDIRRPRRLFPDLKISANLAPGEMLVLTSLPDQSGTLGHHCFTETSTREISQKLLIVRLSQTQHRGE